MDTTNDQRLNELIEEATVDCYGNDEQLTGFFTAIIDDLELPFETVVLGRSVEVTDLDLDSCDRIVARCVCAAAELWISVVDLPLPTPPPAGAEWLAAYRRWREGVSGG